MISLLVLIFAVQLLLRRSSTPNAFDLPKIAKIVWKKQREREKTWIFNGPIRFSSVAFCCLYHYHQYYLHREPDSREPRHNNIYQIQFYSHIYGCLGTCVDACLVCSYCWVLCSFTCLLFNMISQTKCRTKKKIVKKRRVNGMKRRTLISK